MHGIKQKSAARMKFTVNHLEKHLTDFIFQHDNDPKHNAMTVKTYLTLKKKTTHTMKSFECPSTNLETIPEGHLIKWQESLLMKVQPLLKNKGGYTKHWLSSLELYKLSFLFVCFLLYIPFQ